MNKNKKYNPGNAKSPNMHKKHFYFWHVKSMNSYKT